MRREVGSKVGEVLSEERLEDDRQKILKIYQDRNYSDVDVQYRLEEIAGTNRVRVIFQITEGPRLVVRRIIFIGNDSVLRRDIIKVMKTRPWNLLSFFNKSGRLLPAQIEEDRSAIRTLYQNRGFADVEITDVQTQPLERGSRTDDHDPRGHPVSRQHRQVGGRQCRSNRRNQDAVEDDRWLALHAEGHGR